MNFKRKKSGMTLIEIIVSLALLAILAVTFLTLFFGSLKMTQRSGVREQTKVAVTSSMDNLLVGVTGGDPVPAIVPNSKVIIRYPNNSEKELYGNGVTVSKMDANGNQVEIKGFVP